MQKSALQTFSWPHCANWLLFVWTIQHGDAPGGANMNHRSCLEFNTHLCMHWNWRMYQNWPLGPWKQRVCPPQLQYHHGITASLGCQTALKFNNYILEQIMLGNGIGQGDPLSMILYQYYIQCGSRRHPEESRQSSCGHTWTMQYLSQQQTPSHKYMTFLKTWWQKQLGLLTGLRHTILILNSVNWN